MKNLPRGMHVRASTTQLNLM